MKALTIHEPWATAIVYGPKRVENRPWTQASMVGERFAIHTSIRFTSEDSDALRIVLDRCRRAGAGSRVAVEMLAEASRDVHRRNFAGAARAWPWSLGVILGVATVAEWIAGPHRAIEIGQQEWFRGPCAAVLTDVRPVAPRLTARGRQKFWNLPPEIAAAVTLNLKEPVS